MGKEKEKVEYRYYEVPQEIPLLALLGERWETVYGTDSMHFHNILEVGYCYRGEGTIVFKEESLHYQRGTVTVIPQKIAHRTNPIGDPINKWEYLFIDTERFLKENFSEHPVYAKLILERLYSRPLVIPAGEMPKLQALMEEILDEMRGREEFYKICVRGLVLAFLLKIVRMNAGQAVLRESDLGKERLHTIITVLNYIDEHYAENFKIGDLADVCGLSETHFRREFSEYVNASPIEYVNLVRIEKACDLLAQSDEKVDIVALRVGFQNVSTFIRNFKKVTGDTPHQWREDARKNQNNPVNFKVSVLKGW